MSTLCKRILLTGLIVVIVLGSINARIDAREVLPISSDAASNEARVFTFVSPCVYNFISFSKKNFGDKFSAKRICRDLAEIGTTDIFYDDNMTGTVYHSTQVKGGVIAPSMGKRDYLDELLKEAKKYNMNVWALWVPHDAWKKLESHLSFYSRDHEGKINPRFAYGLNHPEVIQYFCDMMDELVKKYGHYGNLRGISLHEAGFVSERNDTHGDDLIEFKDFCRREFQGEYSKDKIPQKANPEDIWWRRYVLYKIEVFDNFYKKITAHAHKKGLKVMSYCANFRRWRDGIDPVHLSEIVDGVRVTIKRQSEDFLNFDNSGVHLWPVYNDLLRRYIGSFAGKDIYIWLYHMYLYPNSNINAFLKKRGVSRSDIDLYYGVENAKKWLKLINNWHGGLSAAKIAVATNTTSFILRNPTSGGAYQYRRKIVSIMNFLSYRYDIDVFDINQKKFKSLDGLKKYKVIIMPQGIFLGVNKDMLELYQQYVRNGGKILSLSARWLTGKRDLTDLKDMTEAMTGVRYKKRGQHSYHSLKVVSDELKGRVEEVKAKYAPKNINIVDAANAEILMIDEETNNPLLFRYRIGKGEVISSWAKEVQFMLSGEEQFKKYLCQVLGIMIDAPIKAEGNLSICQTVIKDGILAVGFWDKGKTLLKIDVRSLGLKGNYFEVRDVLTGTWITNRKGRIYWKQEELRNEGIEIENKTKKSGQVIAIGKKGALIKFTGVLPPGVFATTIKKKEGISKKSRKDEGKKGVGIYAEGSNLRLLSEILKEKGFDSFHVQSIDKEILNLGDAIIICQVKDGIDHDNAKIIREYVTEGGRVVLFHDAVGYKKHSVIFPEIGEGVGNPFSKDCKVVLSHPVTEGLKIGEIFEHNYGDHIQIEPGFKGEVLIRDKDYVKKAVVVAGKVGKVGKAKVVLNGMTPCYESPRGSYGGHPAKPTGAELKIQINTLKWLIGK